MCDIKFAVILVTCNRLRCLQTALEKYDSQTKPPRYILVVDNASNDGTKEYLDQWKHSQSGKYERIVVHCEENTGGAGGFSLGLEEGVKLDCDFLFLSDDDAYAETDMLEQLEKGYHQIKGEKISAICTSVLNHGQYDLGHRCYMQKKGGRVFLKYSTPDFYQNGPFRVNILTFVGAAVKKEVVSRVGLPLKEYFIWYDDTEYCHRLLKEGNIYCMPTSVMHHDVKRNRTPSWKDYYGTRNWLDMIRRHYPKRFFYFAVIEKYLKRASVLSSLFRKRDKKYRKMSLDAIKDAVQYRLWKNEKYMPK